MYLKSYGTNKKPILAEHDPPKIIGRIPFGLVFATHKWLKRLKHLDEICFKVKTKWYRRIDAREASHLAAIGLAANGKDILKALGVALNYYVRLITKKSALTAHSWLN